MKLLLYNWYEGNEYMREFRDCGGYIAFEN